MADPKYPAPSPEDPIEVKCPTCRERVLVAKRDAERGMRAVCSKGHEIPLVRAFG